MDRNYFLKLGAYDPGLLVWGGENFELSFKVRSLIKFCLHKIKITFNIMYLYYKFLTTFVFSIFCKGKHYFYLNLNKMLSFNNKMSKIVISIIILCNYLFIFITYIIKSVVTIIIIHILLAFL